MEFLKRLFGTPEVHIATPTGGETITKALESFTEALEGLEAGIQLTQSESEDHICDLEGAREAFTRREAQLAQRIEDAQQDIDRASKVRDNIQKLLS